MHLIPLPLYDHLNANSILYFLYTQAEPQPTETESDSASLFASLPDDNSMQDVVNELKVMFLTKSIYSIKCLMLFSTKQYI
jgi:hypothetical protein